MTKFTLTVLTFLFIQVALFSQGSYNLYQYTSTDGTTFSQPKLIQDSADVPSLAMDTAGTLYLLYQNFKGCPSFPDCDKIVMRTSADTGSTWSNKSLVSIQNFPAYTRPFDPTILLLPNGNMRLYYSTCTTGSMQLDSTCGTYSALTLNGSTFTYEPGERFGMPTKAVIDPAVIYYNGLYHYGAPAGAPQDGAYHATSNDGLNFTLIDSTQSDIQHNWTGNFMIDDSIRFYGYSSPKSFNLWWASSSDGSSYSSFTHTNIEAKDPAVFKAGPNRYILIAPLDTTFITTGFDHNITIEKAIDVTVFPNPSHGILNIKFSKNPGSYAFSVTDLLGREVFRKNGVNTIEGSFDVSFLETGVYQLRFEGEGYNVMRKILLE